MFFINAEQGMDDRVVPPSVTDYVVRVLPGAIVHKLPNEGHRQIFSTLWGIPQGPLDRKVEMDQTPFEGDIEVVSPVADSTTK